MSCGTPRSPSGSPADLYRLLFANASADLAENEPDGYDYATRQTGYRTFAPERYRSAATRHMVLCGIALERNRRCGRDMRPARGKSHGERLIANFLYLNGVTGPRSGGTEARRAIGVR